MRVKSGSRMHAETSAISGWSFWTLALIHVTADSIVRKGCSGQKGENCFQSSLAQTFCANLLPLLRSLATPAMMEEGKHESSPEPQTTPRFQSPIGSLLEHEFDGPS
jgi:hypothetical protein